MRPLDRKWEVAARTLVDSYCSIFQSMYLPAPLLTGRRPAPKCRSLIGRRVRCSREIDFPMAQPRGTEVSQHVRARARTGPHQGRRNNLMPLSVATFPCCRNHDLFWPMGDHAQAIQRGPVDEAYWLNWTSECRGDGSTWSA